MQTHHKLLIALASGALIGTTLHGSGTEYPILGVLPSVMEPIGQVFLRLIFMIVVPMVFSGLVLGVYQLGSSHGLGKVAGRTLLFTVLSSLASVLIGISLVNGLKPGAGFQVPADLVAAQSTAVEKVKTNAAAGKPAIQAILEIIPKNPLDAAVRALDGEMLALMFFALVFGFALSLVNREQTEKDASFQSPLIKLLEQVYDVCMKVVEFAMKLAPYAVFALVFTTTYKFGYNLLISLFYYVATVVLALALQQFGVYSLMLKFFAKRSPLDFFRDCRDVYVYAFATASSNATLPRSLETAEHKLKLPPAISRFVLTVGSTANQNGTALFEGITVLFLAQVYGVDLTMAQQVQVILMSVLAGIGTAGVPGGSLPLIMILVQQVGIPAEGMGIIMGVDRFLDMCRTTVNVSGDLVIAAVVSSDSKTPQGQPVNASSGLAHQP